MTTQSWLHVWLAICKWCKNSRNTYIHIQQNAFALKALFYIQQLYILCSFKKFYLFNFKEIIYLLTVKEIKNLFKEHIFYSQKVQSFEVPIFVDGIIFISRKYLHLRKTYSFREIISIQKNDIHLRNIYSYKFKSMCSFKETMFIQQRLRSRT